MENEFNDYAHPDEFKHVIINCEFDIPTLLCVLSQVQLATRHPDNNGIAKDIAVKAAKIMQAAIAKAVPELDEIMELGWYSEFDR